MKILCLIREKCKDYIRKYPYFHRLLIWKAPKRINKKAFLKKIIDLSDVKSEYIIASGVVTKVKIKNETLFFRECVKHYGLGRYIDNFIEYFFSEVVKKDENSVYDKERVKSSLAVSDNKKKFINMGAQVFGVDTPVNNFLFGSADSSVLGLDNYGDKEYERRLKSFVRFSCSMLFSYKQNDYAFSKNRLQTHSLCRTYAYQKMAELLNMKNYVADSICCSLKTNTGKIVFGFIQKEAMGIEALKLPTEVRKEKITPTLAKNLLNLNILDYLCEIRDHSPYNYQITLDKNNLFNGVVCFDNDEPCSFGKDIIFNGYRGESCLVTKEGVVNRPYLDENIVNSIFSVDKKRLFLTLKKHMRKKQIYNVWQRLVVLKNAIIKTKMLRKKFIISESEWSENIIKEELSGKYGKTYLDVLLNLDFDEKAYIFL